MTDLKNELSWSFSRHQTLSRCARRYWFHHYGKWGGWERNAPAGTREAYRLSKLEDRASWRGKVVHETIARALQRARRGARQPPPADVLDDVLERMRQDYVASRDDLARRTGRYKDHVRFFEHDEGLDDGSPEWRARWKATATEAETCLRAFFASRLYGQLTALPAADWLEIEDPSAPVGPSFTLDGVRVWVKIDCAWRESDRAVVVDWKTGSAATPLGPVQLATYATYLQAAHGIPPEATEAREVHVATGVVLTHDVGPDALEAFRALFARSVADMRAYLADPAQNVPKPPEAFPYAADERECTFCHFRSLCPRTAPAF